MTHEYLDVLSGRARNLEGISFIDHGTGANRADKYERDIRLLTNAIATERDPGMVARYTFYLANTLRDSGQREAALETYLLRARLGHWHQEVFISLLNAAELKEALRYPNDEVISAYVKATAACPTRAEALHGAARFCRDKGLYEHGYQFATKGWRSLTRMTRCSFRTGSMSMGSRRVGGQRLLDWEIRRVCGCLRSAPERRQAADRNA